MKRADGEKILNRAIEPREIKEKVTFDLRKDFDDQITKPTLLLHSCCGPCSTSVVERLSQSYKITIFFYNPNITDKKEYDIRKAAQINFIDRYNDDINNNDKISFSEGPYEKDTFLEMVKGLEDEKEGGRRCNLCYSQRLEKTAETANLLGYDYFGTTLTVSPHKDFDKISDIGKILSMKYSVAFLNENFKKQDGYKRSIELSKKYKLYRQNYCGCEFSKRGEE